MGGGLIQGGFDEIARLVVRVEQRLDLGAKPWVPGASLIKKRAPLLGIALERGVEDAAHLPPLFRCHVDLGGL